MAHALGPGGRLGDDDPAVGVPDDDLVARRVVEHLAHGADVVTEVAARDDARQVDGDDREPVATQATGHLVPAPGAVPGAVDEHHRRSLRHRPHPMIEAMAGHSKWAGIKHKKAIVDARRGKLFTKLARAITVAAKDGGGDPDTNPARARRPEGQGCLDAQGQHRARHRQGHGGGADTEALEAVLYEGYGPGGVALLVAATTDNRNRTGSEIRHLFSKHGGNLGEPGSVAYLFDKRGLIVVDAARYEEDDLLPAIEAGALDVSVDEDVFEILTEPADLPAVRAALEDGGIELDSSELSQVPKTRVPIDEDVATAHAPDRRARGQRRRRRRARELRRRRGGARARGRVSRGACQTSATLRRR